MELSQLKNKFSNLLIIDGSYMLHRALNVPDLFSLHDSQGRGTGGIMQFMRSLDYVTKRMQDYYPVVVWDSGLSPRRKEVYPDYKANRGNHSNVLLEDTSLDRVMREQLEKELEESREYLNQYTEQRSGVMNILDIMGIPSIRIRDWEGDDIIWLISQMSNSSAVVSDDKDFIQLLSPDTKVVRPLAQEVLEYHEYQRDNNDPGMRRFVLVKSICGDGSDNIPKCADGVGAVTADKIATIILDHGFHNEDQWLPVIRQSKYKAWQKFSQPESIEQLKVNVQLIDLSYVADDADDEILRTVVNAVAGLHAPNLFKTWELLNQYEINRVDINGIVSKLTKLVALGGFINE